ncbi:hypothetical protein V491_08399, partial [Pseudogymnoascus sp. VKM F-3775]
FDDTGSRRSSPRTRSRSPPPSPKGRSNLGARKASLVDLRGRNKSAGPASYNEFGSVNMATEQLGDDQGGWAEGAGSGVEVNCPGGPRKEPQDQED